jgi:peptidoglycan-N-acetylglucosamine deacetylase
VKTSPKTKLSLDNAAKHMVFNREELCTRSHKLREKIDSSAKRRKSMIFFIRRSSIPMISGDEEGMHEKQRTFSVSSASPGNLPERSVDHEVFVERQTASLSVPGPAPVLMLDRGMVISHGNPNLPEVALTFDDGPGQYTSQVMALLQFYRVPATFFSIGQQAIQFPSSLQEEVAGGNAIGNHTLTHPHLTTLSSSAIFQELKGAQEALFDAGGTRPTLFRPPYGEYNEQVLLAAGQLGLTVVTWSAAADDWNDPQPSADVIASRILSAAENGAIFLLHEGGGDRANTVASLPAIITGLQARGLRLVTLPQMLAHLPL